MHDDVLEHRELITSGSIDRAILHLGAPAAAAALLQAGFLVVDTFWLGRVGAVALAAASTAGFVMWLSQAVFGFMGTSEDVSAAGLTYLGVILLGMPAYFLCAWISAAFRAVGDAKTALSGPPTDAVQ